MLDSPEAIQDEEETVLEAEYQDSVRKEALNAILQVLSVPRPFQTLFPFCPICKTYGDGGRLDIGVPFPKRDEETEHKRIQLIKAWRSLSLSCLMH